MERPIGLFAALLFWGARFLPMTLLVPLFGGGRLPAPVRIGTACAFGLVAAGGFNGLSTLTWSISGALAELTTGLLLAMPSLFVVKGLETAGECFDQACGTNAVEIIFPTGEDRASPAGNLVMTAVVLVAFGSGVQLELVHLVMDSFDRVPPGSWPSLTVGAFPLLLRAFSTAVGAGLALGVPFLVVAVGVETALGYADRIAPGFSASSHSMHIKNMLALVVAILAWDRISYGLLETVKGLPATVGTLIGVAGMH